MAKRKQYPLRIDKDVWEAVQKWATDDMRSANGQVEYILRRALRDAGRLPAPSRDKEDGASDESAAQPSQKI